jgi:hypothetical protein
MPNRSCLPSEVSVLPAMPYLPRTACITSHLLSTPSLRETCNCVSHLYRLAPDDDLLGECHLTPRANGGRFNTFLDPCNQSTASLRARTTHEVSHACIVRNNALVASAASIVSRARVIRCSLPVGPGLVSCIESVTAMIFESTLL